jgi:hypothetical protein
MKMIFEVDIADLDFKPMSEPRVTLWRRIIRSGAEIAPIKVVQRENIWHVHSGAEAVEAARREGIEKLKCVAI